MKCLIVTTEGSPETFNSVYVATARACLETMGIEYSRMKSTAVTAQGYASIAAQYDFVLIPQGNDSSHRAMNDSALLTIPVFVLHFNGTTIGNAKSGDAGVTGAGSAATLQFFSSPFISSAWTAATGYWFAAGTGTPLITATATNPRTGAAQTYAGSWLAWYCNSASGKHIYFSCSNAPTSFPFLAFMLQAAYNAGDFTASQMGTLRRAPLIVDQDHVNGTFAAQNTTVLNRWLTQIPATGVSWCGVTANADGTAATVSDDVKAALVNDSGRRLRFVYHEHSTGREPTTGTWPYTANGGSLADSITKTNQDTYYADRVTKVATYGLSFHQPGYYVPGTNRWNEATLQLFSPETSVASDPANATPKAGYGFTVVRGAVSNTASRPTPSLFACPRSVFNVREYARGMTIIPGTDIALEDVLTTDAEWEAKLQYILLAIHTGQAVYVHDDDFMDIQNPQTAEFGQELFSWFGDLNTYLKDTVTVFADPTKNSLSIRQA